MSNLLEDFVKSHIATENGNGFEEFSEIAESVYSEAEISSSMYMSRILESIKVYPDEYITALIEFCIEKIPHETMVSVIKPIFEGSTSIGKSIIIDSFCLAPSKSSIEFLINLDNLETQLEFRRIAAVADIEKTIKTKELKGFLTCSYKANNLPPSWKHSVYECLQNVYQLTLEKDQDHQEWLSKQRQAHIHIAIKSAQEEFKKNRFKTVVKLLRPFETAELPKLGIQLLKVAKRKLQ